MSVDGLGRPLRRLVLILLVWIGAAMSCVLGRMWGERHCVVVRFGARIVGVCGEFVRARSLEGVGVDASVDSC
jgi:hypothetical protein